MTYTLTSTQAGRLLGVGRGRVNQLREDGVLKAKMSPLGGYLYSQRQVEELLRARESDQKVLGARKRWSQVPK